jgi:hypothetical protein
MGTLREDVFTITITIHTYISSFRQSRLMAQDMKRVKYHCKQLQ